MTDVQTISIVVAAVGVLIAAINSIISSRRAEEQRQLTLETQQHALETRQAQLFMQIYDRWNSEKMINAYENVRFKYTKEEYAAMVENLAQGREFNRDLVIDHQTYLIFFEGLGMLVKRGLIDIGMVEDLLSNRVIWFWETRVLPYVDRVRHVLNDPTMYDSLENLYNVMKQREQRATVTT
jgi:hypothetical protein